MRAAVEAGRAAAVARATQAELAVAMTRGALLGAMGNSGVILSSGCAGWRAREAGAMPPRWRGQWEAAGRWPTRQSPTRSRSTCSR
jgi:hypothetical protein